VNAECASSPSLVVEEVASAPSPTPVSRRLIRIQALLGFGSYSLFCLPYLRKIHGLERLDPAKRYLFASNHVSLLDTILLGALCWRSGCYPIKVLGDKHVWRASWIKRALSRHIGFLLDRSKLNPGRIKELTRFARTSAQFHLVVYPEGTRGDGVHVAPCQPGIYYIAQEAKVPIVPMFIANMQLVSTKSGRFHPIRGVRKIDVHFGCPIAPADYLDYSREDFSELIRQGIAAAAAGKPPAQFRKAVTAL
jgi:1-acyl-sn-glycerol-3-phosphate acyltransferase